MIFFTMTIFRLNNILGDIKFSSIVNFSFLSHQTIDMYCLLFCSQDWPSHVNIQKGVLPGLWSLLEGGCHGNGPRVYPSLLPLLHGLMSVYSEDIGFCVNYLQRMSRGYVRETTYTIFVV